MSILQYPHPILDKVSYSAYDNLEFSEIKSLAEEMYHECWKVGGFGISAVQIGKLFRIFGYVDIRKKNIEWVCDPELISATGRISFSEGCLSIPGYFWNISRYAKVLIEYRDLSGKKRIKTFRGIEARVVQHEMDHLDGVVIPDLMSKQEKANFDHHLLSKEVSYKYLPPHIYVR